MDIENTEFHEVKIITFQHNIDQRGSMTVTVDEAELEKAGITFVCKEQRVYSMPQKGTFFGIHFQDDTYPQNKIVHLLAGRGMDYIVDVRKESSTFSKWIQIELKAGDNQHIYIPQGFAHAFLSLEDNTIQLFSIDNPFHIDASKKIRYDDKEINLQYPIEIMHMSDYDKNAPSLQSAIMRE